MSTLEEIMKNPRLGWSHEADKDYSKVRHYLVHESDKTGSPIAFPAMLSLDLVKVLIRSFEEGLRLRIFYGEPNGETLALFDRCDNGRFSISKNFDVVEGVIGISSNQKIKLQVEARFFMDTNVEAKHPLIISHKTSPKGSMLKCQEIVYVECSNKKDGGSLWEHERFNGLYNYSSL